MKHRVNYFVSYAHKNKMIVKSFLEKLDDVLAPSKSFEYSRWQDADLLAGEDWENQIMEAISNCEFGLLLISPAFLASKFITKSELPKFVSGKKISVPVMLQPVDFERHDLKGLDKKQIFMFPQNGPGTPKAYSECKSYRRDAFILELFRQIERKLEKTAKKPDSIIEQIDPLNDLRIVKQATNAYRRRGTPKYFLDSQSLTKNQKAKLYDIVVQSERGKPAKKNPYK